MDAYSEMREAMRIYNKEKATEKQLKQKKEKVEAVRTFLFSLVMLSSIGGAVLAEKARNDTNHEVSTTVEYENTNVDELVHGRSR